MNRRKPYVSWSLEKSAPAQESLSFEEYVLDVSIVVAKSSKVVGRRYSRSPTQEFMAGRIEREWIMAALLSPYGNDDTDAMSPPTADTKPM
jgi:hypothetical protein